MVEIVEMSLRSSIDHDALRAFLAKSFDVDICCIGSSADFWDSAETPNEKSIGLEVLLSDAGFKTLCTLYQYTEFSNHDLLNLAVEASEFFNTECAIGNFIDNSEVSTDQFLIITPNRHAIRAFATANSDVFELSPVDGQLISTDQILNDLRNAQQKQ